MRDFELTKSYNLLDEALAESGLEMQIFGTIGGILQGAAIKEQNSANASAYRLKTLQAGIQANLTNEYNKAAFGIQKANYQTTRAYEWATQLRNYNYQQSIQDFQHLQATKQHLGSVENTQQQLTYNTIAEQQALEGEQAALNELRNQVAFQSEELMLENLQAEGKAAFRQPGQSRSKALQSTVAELGRNNAIQAANLISAQTQSGRNLEDIALRKYAADMEARSGMMIKPERGVELPAPMQAPERMFMAPAQVMAAYVPPPIERNAILPILQGITSDVQMGISIAKALK